MAKRTRGSHAAAAYRPGGAAPARPSTARSAAPRAGSQPPAAIPGAAPRPSQLASALVIADDIESNRPAAAATELRAASRLPGRVKVKPNSLLAARAAEEYLYVGRDLREIALTGLGLVALLIGLWVVFVLVDPFGLY